MREAEIRRAIADVDASLPVIRVQSFGDEVSRTLRQQTLLARLTLLFGLTALVLVSVGTYGVTAYTVQRRTKEIGIRMALGAAPATVLGMVANDAMRVVGFGLVVGVPLAEIVGRLLNSRLYGTSIHDLRILLGAVLTLIISAGVAVLVPAGKAASMPPITALRRE